jgi:thioredoxin reductase/NAD-dependent dihydropyrimidine dehydrogenase PreA subunit
MSTLWIAAGLILLTTWFVARHLHAQGSSDGNACPRCGKEILAGQRRCTGCGVPMQVYEVVTAEIIDTSKTEQDGALHAMVRADVCVGCGACVPACPVAGAIRMEGKLAVVEKSLCVAHGKCIEACPVGGISLGTGDAVHRMEVPYLDANFESNIPGIYIVGELGGRGLIKNAVNEGRLAAEDIAEELKSIQLKAGETALAIVGSGPAGLSAALEAHRRKLDYVVLEQGELVDTIRKYPRKKLLLAEPVHVPLFGELWIADGSKEALLAVWEQTIKTHGLKIRTNERVERIEKLRNGGFELQTAKGRVLARRIILAMGRRGTPRKLGVPGEESAKVFYDIVEMEAFAGDRVLVVGGGDSALESAIGLARQPNTTVHLSYRRDNFERAKERNCEKLEAAVATGSIQLLLESQVREIRPQSVVLEQGGRLLELPNDTVIVRVGGEPPKRFLDEIGIKTVVRGVRTETEAEAAHR